MKTPLGTEVDLGLGHIVLDVLEGVPAAAKGAQQSPSFRPVFIVAMVTQPSSATAELLLYHFNCEEILHVTSKIYHITLIVCAPYFVNLNNSTFQLETLLFFVHLRSQQKRTEKVISNNQIYSAAILTLLF